MSGGQLPKRIVFGNFESGPIAYRPTSGVWHNEGLESDGVKD